MPEETYRYNVIIGVDVSSSGAQRGSKDVESQFTRMEQRAIATVKKIQAEIAKLEAALDRLGTKASGIFSGKGISGIAGGGGGRTGGSGSGGGGGSGGGIPPQMIWGPTAQQATQATQQLNNATNAANKANKSWGGLGQTIKGVFIGMVAGIVFSTIIGGIQNITSSILQTGIAAVQLAGNFELTTKSVAIFSGSIRTAREELAIMDKAALDTPGLRLETAEDGYKRLRALGFAADTTKSIIVGLAKQKLISGASEQDIQRVIVNFTQLSASTARASQDLREIIHAIPSLRRSFFEAFGTVDPQRLRSLIDQDPEKFFKKLGAQMENTRVPTEGLNNAIEKLEDALIMAGRTFGEPLLEPITNALINLTTFIRENGDTWVSWGQSVADVIRGVSAVVGLFDSITNRPAAYFTAKVAGRAALALGTAGLSEGVFSLGNIGEVQRKIEEEKRQKEVFTKFGQNNPNFLKKFAERGYTVDFAGPRSDEELITQQVNAEYQRQQAIERTRLKAVERTKLIRQEELEINKAYYSLEQAALSSHLDLTSEQQLATLKRVSESKANAVRSDIAVETAYYNDMIKMSENDSVEVEKLTREKNITLIKLNADLRKTELENARAIAEAEYKIQEERRKNEIEFLELRIDASRSWQDRETSIVERQISLYETGYGRLIDIVNTSYVEINNLTFQSFQKQLQDASLTAEERLNIQTRMNNELYKQETERNNKVDAIQERSLQAQVRRMREALEQSNQLTQTFGGGLRSIMGTLNADPMFGTTFPTDSIHGLVGDRQGLFDLTAILNVTQGSLSVYDAVKDKLDKIHIGERENIKREIDLQGDLMEIERQRVLLAERLDIMRLENQRSALTKQLSEAINQEQRDLIQQRIGYADQQIGLKQGYVTNLEKEGYIPETAEALRIKNTKTRLLLELDVLRVNQEIEANNLKHAQDLATINALTKEFAEGKRDGLLTTIQEVELTTQRRDATIAFRQQEISLGNENLLNLAREVELIKAITELRSEEMQAIFAIDKAQLRISQQMVYSQNRANARVLEFIASQKGITEILGDAKIQTITTVYEQIDSVFEKLTKRLGVFGSVLKEVLSSFVKLALNKVFMALFGLDSSAINFGGGKSGGGGGGGFNLGGLLNILNPARGAGGGAAAGAAVGGGGGSFLSFMTSEAYTGIPGGIGGAAAQSVPGLASGGGATGGFGGVLKSLFGGGGGLAGLAPLAPLLGASLGASLGGQSGAGQILGGLGGLLGGVGALGLIGGAGALAPAFGALGLGLSASLTAAAAATVVGLVAAPLLLFGAFILGRNKRRRQEERIRNQALLSAFDQIDKLIEGVRGDRIDGAQALEQASQIRAQYVEEMNKLKDKKTRRHALQDVSRIDAKINELKGAVDAQKSRKDKMNLLVPTFGDGGSISSFSRGHRGNPLGYVEGPGTGISDSIPAYISNGEYVLDAETTKNLGVRTLDNLRFDKGRGFNKVSRTMRHMYEPRSLSTGGIVMNSNVSGPPVGLPGSGPSSSQNTPKVSVVNNIYQTESGARVQTDVFMDTIEGKKKIESVVEDIIYKGGAGGKIPIAMNRVSKGQR